MARLKVVKNGEEIQHVDLGRGGRSVVRVGRAADSDVCLDDRAVGREHAVITFGAKGAVVQKKTKFGRLAVNGQETNECVLKSGDVLSIASFQVFLEELEELGQPKADSLRDLSGTATIPNQPQAPVLPASPEQLDDAALDAVMNVQPEPAAAPVTVAVPQRSDSVDVSAEPSFDPLGEDLLAPSPVAGGYVEASVEPQLEPGSSLPDMVSLEEDSGEKAQATAEAVMIDGPGSEQALGLNAPEQPAVAPEGIDATAAQEEGDGLVLPQLQPADGVLGESVEVSGSAAEAAEHAEPSAGVHGNASHGLTEITPGNDVQVGLDRPSEPSAPEPTKPNGDLEAMNAAGGEFNLAGAGAGGATNAGGAGGASSGGSVGDKTAVITAGKVVAKLVFKPGEALKEEYILDKTETSIGRGAACDVVINDAKSSRKHLILRKAGATFMAVDLGSANGTYVNGARITNQELAGDDVLRIGTTEFTFRAMSEEYFQQQQDFMPASQASLVLDNSIGPAMEAAAEAPAGEPFGSPNGTLNGIPVLGGAAQFPPGGAYGGPAMGSIPGINQAGGGGKKGLMARFRELPPVRKAMILIALLMLVVLIPDEEAPKTSQGNRGPAAVESADASFEKLPRERQQFVINTYNILQDHFKNHDYERTIFEAKKILEILPGGYKDAISYKETAERALADVLQKQEEQRRLEAEQKLANEVQDLLVKVQALIDVGKDLEAADQIILVLEKDPENPTALRLKDQIDERVARKKAERQMAEERAEKMKTARAMMRQARAYLKVEKFMDAIEKTQGAVLYIGDEEIIRESDALMAEIRAALDVKIGPSLEAARSALQAGNYAVARDSFIEVLAIDPTHGESKAGMQRIREILVDQAKTSYVEGLVNEAFSDFVAARGKYKDCLDQAMPDDVYYGRCYRKYKRLEYFGRTAPAEGSDESARTPSSEPRRVLPPAEMDIQESKDGTLRDTPGSVFDTLEEPAVPINRSDAK